MSVQDFQSLRWLVLHHPYRALSLDTFDSVSMDNYFFVNQGSASHQKTLFQQINNAMHFTWNVYESQPQADLGGYFRPLSFTWTAIRLLEFFGFNLDTSNRKSSLPLPHLLSCGILPRISNVNWCLCHTNPVKKVHSSSLPDNVYIYKANTRKSTRVSIITNAMSQRRRHRHAFDKPSKKKVEQDETNKEKENTILAWSISINSLGRLSRELTLIVHSRKFDLLMLLGRLTFDERSSNPKPSLMIGASDVSLS